MPPKLKLHPPNKKKPSPGTKANEPGPSNPTISPEVAQQFEVELYWCIQQLQKALDSGKLNQKQVQDNTKILNILMSNNTSMIKKRQAMWQTFGDYRTKMNEEEAKLTRGRKIKISTAQPNKKSIFVKKASETSTASTSNSSDITNGEPSTGMTLGEEINKVAKIIDSKVNITEKFQKSDNSFRFNFTCDET